MNGRGYLRSALFVDFDNAYLQLQAEDEALADAVFRQPSAWIAALETRVPVPAGQGADARRVLVRRVYLNPKSFAAFRPFYTAAGFEVVDCPPLTARGKTGADIQMVLDAMDLFGGPVAYDECVIMSADTDFAALLLRLRRLDVRTLVMATGQCSPAYRHAADRLLEQEALIEVLRDGAPVPGGAARPATPGPAAPGAVPLDAVAPVGVAPDAERLAAAARCVVEAVAQSSTAVDLASLGHRLRDRFAGIGADWLGFERLSALVDALPLDGLERSALSPGYVYDPVRHEPPVPPQAVAERDAWLDEDPPLGELVRRLSRLTGVPMLAPERYDAVYDAIADCVAQTGETHITNLSRRVRDACAERGTTVSRRDATFVVDALTAGFDAGLGGLDAETLGLRMLEATVAACAALESAVSDDERALLEDWLVPVGDEGAEEAVDGTLGEAVDDGPPPQ